MLHSTVATKVVKQPIILILFFLATGILANYHLRPSFAVISLYTAVAVLLFAFSFTKSQRSLHPRPYFLLATCMLSFGTGMLTHWLHYAPNNNLHYSHLLTDSEVPVIKGVVTERLKPTDYYQKYYFKVQSVNKEPAMGQLLLAVPKDSLQKPLHSGDILVIVDNPQPISKSSNPNQFDYSEYMAKQNIFHQLRLKENYIAAGREKNSDYYLGTLRASLINSFDIHNYPTKVKNMINALLLGQRQDMDKQTSEEYTNAGVIHILAISGLHFATLFYILSLLLTPLRKFNKSGELWQLVIVLAILWTFAFITGLSASVVRSVVMFSFVGIGRYFNRNSNIFNSIAVSMLVLLLAKPNFLFDVGFQLSYAAVFAIVWLQPLYSRVRTSKYKAVNYLTDTIVISLIAQIGVLPLSLYYFNQFPLLFLLANIIVIPLSTAVLLLALVVLILNFTIPYVAIWVGKALAILITSMNEFTAWIASFESLVIEDIPFTLLLNIALYACIILAVRWMYQKSYKRTMAVLASVLAFQLVFTVTSLGAKTGNELIVFNNRENTLITVKNMQRIALHSNDSLAAGTAAIKDYNKENFNPALTTLPLKNILWHNNKRILILDSLSAYPSNVSPDILLLTQSPKTNIEHILLQLKPKQVVADATNYKSYISRWKATCKKLEIPFHDTTDKGFFKVD